MFWLWSCCGSWSWLMDEVVVVVVLCVDGCREWMALSLLKIDDGWFVSFVR